MHTFASIFLLLVIKSCDQSQIPVENNTVMLSSKLFFAFGENVSGSLLLRIGNKLLRKHFEFIYEIKRCLPRFASTKQACVAKILIKRLVERLVKLKKKFLNATK